MVQEFYILRCCTCNFFQVHIMKKAKTWVCKMCGFKQSIIKVYGQGSARECRMNVQKLNERCQNEHETILEESTIVNAFNNSEENISQSSVYEDESFEHQTTARTFHEEFSKTTLATGAIKMKKSKWSAYLDDESENIQLSKKYKQDLHTDELTGNTPSKIIGNQNWNSTQCLEERTERSPRKLDRIQNGPAPYPRLRSTEELLKTFSANSESNSESLRELKACGDGNDKKYGISKSFERCSSINSSDSKIKATKTSTLFLSDEEDIDSILDL